MAERGGFEPPVPLLGVHTISSRAPSTARSPLPAEPDLLDSTRGLKLAQRNVIFYKMKSADGNLLADRKCLTPEKLKTFV